MRLRSAKDGFTMFRTEYACSDTVRAGESTSNNSEELSVDFHSTLKMKILRRAKLLTLRMLQFILSIENHLLLRNSQGYSSNPTSVVTSSVELPEGRNIHPLKSLQRRKRTKNGQNKQEIKHGK